MTSLCKGTVLWFREMSGKGMVREAGGRQYFFAAEEAEDLTLEPGLMVEFELSEPETGPPEAKSLQYEGGRRNITTLYSANKPKGRVPSAKQRQAAKRAKRKPAVPKKPKGAMEDGLMVSHPEWGAGHVVASTKKLVSVEFLNGQRKTYKPSELKDISGPDAPKAPKRRRRKKAAAAPAKSGKNTVRRKKSDGS